MEAHADTHLMRSDATQGPLTESLTDTPLNEGSVPNGEYIDRSRDGGDEHISILPLKEENSETEINVCTHLQTEVDRAIPEEIPPSGLAIVLAPSIDINGPEVAAAYLPELPLLRARALSAATPPRGVDPDDRPNLVQLLHTSSDDVQSASIAYLTDEEGAETREDEDCACDRFLPSLPPSSSPPQLFSSSPCISSQSSGSGVEALVVAGEGCASSRDCAYSTREVSISPDDSHSEPEDLPSLNTADAPTSSEADKFCSQTGPLSAEDDVEIPKRTADFDEPHAPQPFKRPKLDSHLYFPPTPKRATLASQHHQFKKLSAPFRPPLKFPTTTDGLVQAVRTAEQTINATPETNHDKTERKESTIQSKAPSTSKPVTQFKSPLVNRVLPTDARTIRLTPALQALERKLQLLKRAIKVKDDDDEQVLVNLTKKWVEAGREVAYDVWDATKDAGNFGAKVTFTRRLRGWESADDGDMPWGWDSKPGEKGEESCGLDPSGVPYVSERQSFEEDDDAGCHTLGTMLRQLGIAPEIFGWDDDKETFSD